MTMTEVNNKHTAPHDPLIDQSPVAGVNESKISGRGDSVTGVTVSKSLLPHLALAYEVKGMRDGALNYLSSAVSALFSPIDTLKKAGNGMVQYHRFARMDDSAWGNLVYSPIKTIPFWVDAIGEGLHNLVHTNPEIRGEAWAEAANPFGKLASAGAKLATLSVVAGVTKKADLPDSESLKFLFGDVMLYYHHPKINQLEHIVEQAAKLTGIKNWQNYVPRIAITDSPLISAAVMFNKDDVAILTVNEKLIRSDNVETLFLTVLHELNHQRQFHAMADLRPIYEDSLIAKSLIEILVEARSHGIMRRNSLRVSGKELPTNLSQQSADYISAYLAELNKLKLEQADAQTEINVVIAKAHRYIRIHFNANEAERIIQRANNPAD